MFNLKLPARAGVCFALLSSPAFAQDDDRRTILITASKFAETVDETLSPVTVITRDDIERKQAATVQEVLRAAPGVAVANSGGTGQLTSVFLRGAESNHVLVLIDGVKVGGATAGIARFEHLPLEQVEKIEVVRGPRSSLYGSEAIGGVIQIFTRKDKTRPSLSVTTGSHDSYKVEGGVGGGDDDAWFRIGASHHTTGGFNACRGPGGCFTVEPDDDGYKNNSFSLRGGVALTDALTVEGNLLNADGETEFDGFFSNESETVNRVAGVKATVNASEVWRSSLLLARAEDQSDGFKDGTRFSTIDASREQINWQNNFRLNENNRVVAGVDYIKDDGESVSVFGAYREQRDNTGVFALWRSAVGGNDFELSVRNDDNQQFGDHATGSAAWGRDLGGGERVTASFATAFSAPTFDDLYNPDAPNPDLEPEESKSFDVGWSRAFAGGRLAVNLYHTKIDDLIALDSADNFRAFNTDESEISGVELAGFVAAAGWDLHANMTFQNAKNTGGGDHDGNDLIRRPRYIVSVDIDRRFDKHRLGASLLTRGKTFDDAANTRVVPRFTTLDLRGERKLNKNWSLALSVKNIFDEGYEVVEYYPQDRRNFTATLRYLP